MLNNQNTSSNLHFCSRWVDSYNGIDLSGQHCIDDLQFIHNLYGDLLPNEDITKIGRQKWDIISANQNGVRLKTWYCNGCELNGDLNNLYKLTGINYLELQSNNIQGIIPGDVCELPMLKRIKLDWNQLCPPYPECLSESSINKLSQMCGGKNFENATGYKAGHSNTEIERIIEITRILLKHNKPISIENNPSKYFLYQMYDLNYDGIIDEVDISNLIEDIITNNRAANRSFLKKQYVDILNKHKRKLSIKFSESNTPNEGNDRSCNSGWIGDGCCDPACNNEEYGYDGGDCCLSTCLGGGDFDCGDCGYECLDPNAAENDIPDDSDDEQSTDGVCAMTPLSQEMWTWSWADPCTGCNESSDPYTCCEDEDWGPEEYGCIWVLPDSGQDEEETFNNPMCNAEWIGDGCCDPSCNTLEYNWDGGDCCQSTCAHGTEHQCGSCGYECLDPGAVEHDDDPGDGDAMCNEAWIGDGCCDPSCNRPEYNWDGGDCCESTCVSGSSECGSCGYECLDPGADENIEFIPGDVNFDGEINILDVVAIIHHILGMTPLITEEELSAADFDGNGEINVLDLVGMIDIILEDYDRGSNRNNNGNNTSPEILMEQIMERTRNSANQKVLLDCDCSNSNINIYYDCIYNCINKNKGLGKIKKK